MQNVDSTVVRPKVVDLLVVKGDPYVLANKFDSL